MGLHTGEPTVGDEGYLGLDVVRAARICSAGHGGQILLSETTRALLGNDLPDGASVVDLGEAKLKDIQHERRLPAVARRRHALVPAAQDRGSEKRGRATFSASGSERHVAEQIEHASTAPSGGSNIATGATTGRRRAACAIAGRRARALRCARARSPVILLVKLAF